MQPVYWTRISRQLIHIEPPKASASTHFVFRFQQNRRLAARQPPGFGSSTSASAAPRSHKSKPLDNDVARPSPSKERKNTNAKSPLQADKTEPPRKFSIRPGKILIYSLLAYIGYRAYIWHTNPKRSRILDPYNFTPFILEKREKVSSTSSILNIKSLPKDQNTDNVNEAWKTGVWSVQAMQPELQIARSYTPLPPTEDAEPEELRLFVRKEPQGEVSSFLHRICRGTLVLLRGPHIEYEIPEIVNEVLFLAGGTGIAPALQVAHVLYNYRTSTSEDRPKMRILWANRRREDSYAGQESLLAKEPQTVLVPELRNRADKLQGQSESEASIVPDEANAALLQPQTALVAEIESLKARYPGKVEIDYFVDEDDSHITKSLLSNYLSSTDQVSGPANQDRPASKRLLLVSGPEGFIDFYAGPKSMRGGKEIQGPLGGVLQQMNPQGWEIWKL